MLEFDFDRSTESMQFLANEVAGLPVKLVQSPGAEIVWVNPRAAEIDPAFALHGGMGRYERHLLNSCSYVISPAGRVTGWVDRYGGDGIGPNGGSGRAALVNGYYLKGIGRTPLVADSSDPLHATGRMDLHEAVREAIFGELIGAEFPWSAVPVLAIIAIALPVLGDADRALAQTSVILVRPDFTRPAHFMRAERFKPRDRTEHEADVDRVRYTVSKLCLALSDRRIADFVCAMMGRWAEQIAYGFIHRLSQGGLSPSNITIDGRLVDFGSTTALPSWANIPICTDGTSLIDEIGKLRTSFGSFVANYNRYKAKDAPSIGDADTYWQRILGRYQARLSFELLRLCGVGEDVAAAGVVGVQAPKIQRALSKIVRYYRTETVDWRMNNAEVGLPWVMDRLWSREPPGQLTELREIVSGLVPVGEQKACRERCRYLASDRGEIFGHSLNDAILAALGSSGNEDVRKQATSLIGRIISAARRS